MRQPSCSGPLLLVSRSYHNRLEWYCGSAWERFETLWHKQGPSQEWCTLVEASYTSSFMFRLKEVR
ncbi:hypothetical protein ABBQ32_010389 [Trebouxia sp. C0010 RCD-2024]